MLKIICCLNRFSYFCLSFKLGEVWAFRKRIMKVLLIIGTGGFLGSISRYMVQQVLADKFGASFPYGTLAVNIIGSFIIGIVYALFERGSVLSPEWRLFLAVGFCGGFTTFSSFAFESIQMLRLEQFLYLSLYMSFSLIGGLMATYLGILSIKLL